MNRGRTLLPAPGVDERLARLATPDPKRFWAGVLFGVLSAAAAIGLTWASAYLISASALRPPILTLMAIIVSVRVFALGRASFRYIERLLSHDAAFRMLGRLRVGVFERLIPGAPANLSHLGRGDLMSRFVSDIDDLQDLPLRVWQPLLTSLLVSAVTTALLALISPMAGLVLALSLIGAAVLGGVLPERATSARTRDAAPVRAAQNEHMLRMLESMDVLTAYDALPQAQREAQSLAWRQSVIDRSRAATQGLVDLCLTGFTGIAVIGAIWAGGTDLQAGAFPSSWLAVLVLVPMTIFDVFSQVPTAMTAIEKVRVASHRIGAVIDDGRRLNGGADDAGSGAGADGDAGAEPAPQADERASAFASLQLRDVSIGWPGAPIIAEGIDLDLRPGRRVLITGASGAGKSTLAATLVRFLDHRSGGYAIDAQDVRDLGGDRVRRVVGLCEQRPHLFASTVRANLLLAQPEAEDDLLLAVLRRVGLNDLIESREGLDTVVGENGQLLSGGQVQRLALARALLAEFPVIVFDEPTANVDPELADELLVDLLAIAGTHGSTRDGQAPAVVLMSHDRVPSALVDEHLHLADGRLTRVDAVEQA